MKEATLSTPSSPASRRCNNNSDVQEYQVDNVSTSSCKDSDSDDETERTVAVSNGTSLPTIESVSVVNSNDVFIGNTTEYQGPVTIKQIIYPNGALPAESINLQNGENNVTVKLNGFPAAHGVDNPSFQKDSLEGKGDASNDKDVVQNNNARHTLSRIRKGSLWLRNLSKKHTTGIVIFFSALVVVIIVVVTFIYWRQPLPLVKDYSRDTDEQENNTPREYDSDSNSTINERLRIVPRRQWLAQPPTHEADLLKTPVPLVIIQHTATENCISLAQCIYQVRQIQHYHVESNHWWDIGYNFIVGGDGAAYEGRGWKYEGAHTFGYNYKSIGVAFIGTFNNQLPPKTQIAAFKKLVAKGVDLGYIQKDYKILGARQLYGTESPGAVFQKEIETWPHWSKQP